MFLAYPESGQHRACPAIASPAMNGDSLVVLQRVVCDLEELGDLVWSRRLKVLNGDEVDGESLDRHGGRRCLGGETHQMGNLI